MSLYALNERAEVAAGRPLTSWIRPSAGEVDPARELTFYTGTHAPDWLADGSTPWFVSRTRLARYRTEDGLPRAQGIWAFDSGGFTELQKHGEWTIGEDEYASLVIGFMESCGAPPRFVAPMDWMCEPWVIRGGIHQRVMYAGTGLDEETHQQLTVENFLYLREQFPFVPWMPVVQGWDDYLRCVRMYEAAGIDLTDEPIVGLGSVCRRQSTADIVRIVTELHGLGLRLHGFGMKKTGLRQVGHLMASADSMAWSTTARVERIKLPVCEHAGWCGNCRVWAKVWREQVLDAVREGAAGVPAPGVEQLTLEWPAA